MTFTQVLLFIRPPVLLSNSPTNPASFKVVSTTINVALHMGSMHTKIGSGLSYGTYICMGHIYVRAVESATFTPMIITSEEPGF